MCVYKTEDGKCKKFSDDKTNSWCVNGPCEYEKLSNYDRIRNMSIEEMASFICGICDDYDDLPTRTMCYKFINGVEIPDYDEDSIKQWLESEAE